MSAPRDIFAGLEAERTIALDRYKEDGCGSREEYLRGLAEETGASIEVVIALAEALGPDEDFDGLVVALEDGA